MLSVLPTCRYSLRAAAGVFSMSLFVLLFAIGCDSDDGAVDGGNGNANPAECQGRMTAQIVGPDGSSDFEATQAGGSSATSTVFSASGDQAGGVITVRLYMAVDDIEIGKAYELQNTAALPIDQRIAEADLRTPANPFGFNSIAGTVTITDAQEKSGSNTGAGRIVLLAGRLSAELAETNNASNTRQIEKGEFSEVLIATN